MTKIEVNHSKKNPPFSLRTIRNLILGIAFLVIAFGLGYNAGVDATGPNNIIPVSQIAGRSPNKPLSVDFSLFWNVWDRLNRYYVDKTKIDPQKMVYGAISGMVNSLGDPYTVFLAPAQNQEAKDDLGGKLEGVGIQLGMQDKKIVVVAPLKGAPAVKAGIKSGDVIVKVDGRDTADWTLPEAVTKIRGPKGTSVTLTVLHKNTAIPVDIKVVRDTITVSSVDWNTVYANCSSSNTCAIVQTNCPTCDEVIYLKLSRFGDQTSDEWSKAVSEISREVQKDRQGRIKGLVLDLRDNPGGYLSGSVFIASEFLKDGTVVVQDSTIGGRETYSVNRKGALLSIPMVVLINKGTASAAEIVAGALHERGRARLVGETSFGKGSVQEAQDLPGGAGIHITVAKWLLPSGKWINGTGIDPDIKVVNDDTKPDEDLQLQRAVEALVK